MSVLRGVLFEELERLENNKVAYEEMLAKLPRGTIFVRKMGKSSFVYRKRKEQGKVVSEYLGNNTSEKAKQAIEEYNEYRRLRENIRSINCEIVILRKACKLYE